MWSPLFFVGSNFEAGCGSGVLWARCDEWAITLEGLGRVVAGVRRVRHQENQEHTKRERSMRTPVEKTGTNPEVIVRGDQGS